MLHCLSISGQHKKLKLSCDGFCEESLIFLPFVDKKAKVLGFFFSSQATCRSLDTNFHLLWFRWNSLSDLFFFTDLGKLVVLGSEHRTENIFSLVLFGFLLFVLKKIRRKDQKIFYSIFIYSFLWWCIYLFKKIHNKFTLFMNALINSGLFY